VPRCPRCPLRARPWLKPTITFFGEPLADDLQARFAADAAAADVAVVVGTSLKVRPVADAPRWLPAAVPCLLINREPLPHRAGEFDVELLGDCGAVLAALDCGGVWTQPDAEAHPRRFVLEDVRASAAAAAGDDAGASPPSPPARTRKRPQRDQRPDAQATGPRSARQRARRGDDT
jgi:hypothetical protein